jgi:hypothetical protein
MAVYIMRIMCLVPVLLTAQWEKPVKLAHLTNSGILNPPSISASLGGVVHVVWCDQPADNPQIFYRRSEDGGVTWQPEMRLTEPKSAAVEPQVSIAGVMNPITHVAWVDDRDGNKEIYYKRSTDWGVTWSDDMRLTNTAGISGQPDLRGCVCCGTDVRLMWVDDVDGHPAIFYKISTDNGIAWSGDLPITDQLSLPSGPSFAFCLSMVQAVWTDSRNGQPEIWGCRSTDGGLNWSMARCLSDPLTGPAAFPAITHAPNQFDSTLQLFWINQVNKTGLVPVYDILYRASSNLGSSWNPAVRLTEYEMTKPPTDPTCAALGSTLYIILENPGAGIRYRSSFDKGNNWHAESSAAIRAEARIGGPSIALAGKILHMVWIDEHNGKPELYYLRNPNGNPVPIE